MEKKLHFINRRKEHALVNPLLLCCLRKPDQNPTRSKENPANHEKKQGRSWPTKRDSRLIPFAKSHLADKERPTGLNKHSPSIDPEARCKEPPAIIDDQNTAQERLQQIPNANGLETVYY
jgi:hypothetical protein